MNLVEMKLSLVERWLADGKSMSPDVFEALRLGYTAGKEEEADLARKVIALLEEEHNTTQHLEAVVGDCPLNKAKALLLEVDYLGESC